MEDLEQVLTKVEEKLDGLKEGERTGDRFVSQHSSAEWIESVRSGSSMDLGIGAHAVSRKGVGRNRGESPRGDDLLRAIVAARRGDPDAHRRLTKGWVETTGGSGAAGGFLVDPEFLPGYLPARRAAAPLRELCSVFAVNSDEVYVAVEGNTITVAHTAEAATKPSSTGTVAQKVSTIFKVAGVTALSDELLNDSNGRAADLVSRQFGTQIGIAVDTAMISGTGTGQPTGIRGAAGVTSTAVAGLTGRLLWQSIVGAIGRLRTKYFTEDEITVVVHPRDMTKFELAEDTQQRPLYAGGLSSALPGGTSVIVDANIPSNLGGATNETVILVGAFRAGAYFFERQPLTIDVSSDAGFTTDESLYRGLERWGFAVVDPGAFEVLTGITP